MISSKIKKVLRSPRIGLSRIWMMISPMIQSSEFYLKVYYRLRTGRKLNLENPKSFQEKTQWLKLHNTDPLFSKLVDKYEVRKYVAERIGEEHLIPLYGVYDNFDEIDFNNLPNQFVLKSTHDSGSVVICKDKSSFNVGRARRKLNKSLKRNYFYNGREYPYKNVKPRLVAEKYMVDAGFLGGLPDYKFFTFDGMPAMLYVAEGRFSREGAKYTFFDLNWNELPIHAKGHLGDGKPTELTAPDCFGEMKEIVRKLCLDIPFVRIDLYTVNNKIYFGEYTFHHDGGVVDYEPAEWNDKLGDMIILPIDK